MIEDLLKELDWRFKIDTRRGTIINRKTDRPAGHVTPTGVIKITVGQKEYYAHRLIWLVAKGEWPKGYLKRKNGRVEDNRISNLEDTGDERF